MPAPVRFTVTHAAGRSAARTGVLETPHGAIETPAFAPVATQASVKGLTPAELRDLGVPLLLANTYHLYLRPGDDLIAGLGGLHRFMGWDGPLMTDSGGFQVFSLGFGMEQGVGKIGSIFPEEDHREPTGREPHARLVRIDRGGVTFTSHIDGSEHRFTPERSIEIQERLGADIVLAFDECTSPLHDHRYTRRAMERTHQWALRCLRARSRADQALFGIVQGGAYQDLREESARYIGGLPFDGLAVGGSLGRSKADMHRVLEWTVPLLPPEQPRHLLGIGEPDDLLECTLRGIDTFDCAAPTRQARNGALLTPDGRINIRNARYARDERPVEAGCPCPACARFSRAYLRHLFMAGELLAPRLATLHNLSFVLRLMERIRAAIREDRLADLRDEFLARYRAGRPEQPRTRLG